MRRFLKLSGLMLSLMTVSTVAIEQQSHRDDSRHEKLAGEVRFVEKSRARLTRAVEPKARLFRCGAGLCTVMLPPGRPFDL